MFSPMTAWGGNLKDSMLPPALFVVLWSTGFIGARYGMPHAEPMTFLLLRFVLVEIVLIPACLLGGISLLAPGLRLMHASVVGILLHSIYLGGVFYAIRHGMSAGLAALIVSLQPILTSIVARLMLKEAISRRQWAGLTLGFIGIILVLSPKLLTDDILDGFMKFSWEGVLTCLLSLAGITAGTLYQKKFCAGEHLLRGAVWQFMAATVFTGVLALTMEEMRVAWNGEFIFALLWLTLALSIGAVGILMFLIRHGAASRTSSLFYLVPGLTAVEAYVLFGESVSLVSALGIALSLSGVGLVINKDFLRKVV